jgi:hypothetical protein
MKPAISPKAVPTGIMLMLSVLDVVGCNGGKTAETTQPTLVPEVAKPVAATPKAAKPEAIPQNKGGLVYENLKTGDKTCVTTVCDPNCRMVQVACK